MNPKVRGGGHGGLPLDEPSRDRISPPCLGGPWGLAVRLTVRLVIRRTIPLGAMGTMGTIVGPRPMAPAAGRGGDALSRGYAGSSISPTVPLGDPPQMAPRSRDSTMNHSGGPRSHLFYRFLPIFRTFLGEYPSMLLFDMHADFFGRFDLRRNRLIRSGALVEAKSILLLLRRLEASE